MRSIDISQRWPDMGLPDQVTDLLGHGKSVRFPRSREEVLSMAMGEQSNGLFEVSYDVPGRGRVVVPGIGEAAEWILAHSGTTHV